MYVSADKSDLSFSEHHYHATMDEQSQTYSRATVQYRQQLFPVCL